MSNLRAKHSAKLKMDCRHMPALIREHRRRGREDMAKSVEHWLERTTAELRRRGEPVPAAAALYTEAA